jgi:hypothetical protein
MKIINTDNFGGDYPDEKFLSCGPQPIIYGKDNARRIADALNKEGGPNSSRFWRVVEDDYILQPGFEP